MTTFPEFESNVAAVYEVEADSNTVADPTPALVVDPATALTVPSEFIIIISPFAIAPLAVAVTTGFSVVSADTSQVEVLLL